MGGCAAGGDSRRRKPAQNGLDVGPRRDHIRQGVSPWRALRPADARRAPSDLSTAAARTRRADSKKRRVRPAAAQGSLGIGRLVDWQIGRLRPNPVAAAVQNEFNLAIYESTNLPMQVSTSSASNSASPRTHDL